MNDYSVGEHGASQGLHGLAHRGADTAMVQCREPDGLDMRVDLRPLPGPVCADRILAGDSPPSQPFGQSMSSAITASARSMPRALNAR